MSLEFNLVLKEEQLAEKFEAKWNLWCPAIIDYALHTKHKPVVLKHALRDLESDYEGEFVKKLHSLKCNGSILYLIFLPEKDSITAFHCLGYFLRTKKRGEIHDSTVDVPFLMCQAPVRRNSLPYTRN